MMPPLTPQQRILLIEDSPEDIVTVKRNLQKSGLRNPVHVCENGNDALDYLFQRGTFADPNSAPRPGVILLDLNLPDMDGIEVLLTIKEDPGLRSIPVIIMTSSPDERDFEESHQAGADTYLVKPVDFVKFFEALHQHPVLSFELIFFPVSEEQDETEHAYS